VATETLEKKIDDQLLGNPLLIHCSHLSDLHCHWFYQSSYYALVGGCAEPKKGVEVLCYNWNRSLFSSLDHQAFWLVE